MGQNNQTRSSVVIPTSCWNMSNSQRQTCCKQLSWRTLVFIFFVLSFLGSTQIFLTSFKRSSTTLGVTMRVKVDTSYAIRNDTVELNKTSSVRKEECINCFNHDFKYLINNPGICKLYSNQTEIEVFIVILSVHNNTMERNALRETWLMQSKNNSANVRYAFLFGQIQNTELQSLLFKENEQFGDIIQEDFVDTYTNLTYKTMMGLKWAVSYCSVAKALLKTDDDMYINVPKVLDIVRKEFIMLQTNIVGACSQVAHPIRDTKSKWYASVQSFPGKSYAGFCSGTGYLTSINVVRKVYEISPHVPFFHLEDIYVALCIKKLGYHLKDYSGFHPWGQKLDPCLYKGDTLVTAHNMTPNTTRQMWTTKCDPLARLSGSLPSITGISKLCFMLLIVFAQLL